MTALEVLQQSTVEGNTVKLPSVQLDRSIYMEVKKKLEKIGGAWKGGKTQGFVFPTNPEDLLKQIAGGENRNLKKEFQFFETPEKIVDLLVYYAEIKPEHTILEPSAGRGAIIKGINKFGITPDCYELMDQNIEILKNSGLRFNFKGKDFLKNDRTRYDRIIANPPFTKNQDIDHIIEMYECLKPGGILVSVASTSWDEGSQIKQKFFRNWIRQVNTYIIELPSGAFKESGTMVPTVILVINKPLK